MLTYSPKADAEMVDTALRIMIDAHFGQTCMNGEPYSSHSLYVGGQFKEPRRRAAGFLHDVVEDSSITLEDLRRTGVLPSEVVEAVDCLTKREGESYEAYLERVAASPIATDVKIEDLRHNMQVDRLPRRRGLTEGMCRRLGKYLEALEYLERIRGTRT